MTEPVAIEVYADWDGLGGPARFGTLRAESLRRKQVFSFEYASQWLEGPGMTALDPSLALFPGRQCSRGGEGNFGLFLDSSPDRWGRVLMDRRAAFRAREEGALAPRLLETDYLLGVHDAQRLGALRFRTSGPFLADREDLAAPHWASLRALEHASDRLQAEGAEQHKDYGRWLRMLIAPGSSLGGARPKAGIIDTRGGLWIAKFPGRADRRDVGAWETVVHELAVRAQLDVPEARCERFGSKHHTFLVRRFDRKDDGVRIHAASAMTLLERADGDDSAAGASYLELADFLVRSGAETTADLQQLWRRIVFYAMVSNTDDHLRNHAFLLGHDGWRLAPAYDVNPEPDSEGLTLNIDEFSNAQDPDLLFSVAEHFRVSGAESKRIYQEVRDAVRSWRDVAQTFGLPASDQVGVERAFRLAGD